MNLGVVLKQEIRRIARSQVAQVLKPLISTARSQRKSVVEAKASLIAVKKLARSQTTTKSASQIPRDKSRRFSPARLAALRNKKGLTLEQFAKLTGTSVPTLLKWLAGKSRPSEDQLHRIAWVRAQGKKQLSVL